MAAAAVHGWYDHLLARGPWLLAAIAVAALAALLATIVRVALRSSPFFDRRHADSKRLLNRSLPIWVSIILALIAFLDDHLRWSTDRAVDRLFVTLASAAIPGVALTMLLRRLTLVRRLLRPLRRRAAVVAGHALDLRDRRKRILFRYGVSLVDNAVGAVLLGGATCAS